MPEQILASLCSLPNKSHKGNIMRNIIYLVGLVVIVLAIVQFVL